MLRISKQVDYGILILTHCSDAPGNGIQSTRHLASETGLPVPMVSKILKRLAPGGILLSRRGAAGGYSLARPPAEITLAAVVSALEGPLYLVECAEGPSESCRVQGPCRVQAPLLALHSRLSRLLEELTLLDLISPTENGENGRQREADAAS